MTVAAFAEPFTGPEVLVYESALTPSDCARVTSLAATGMRPVRGGPGVRKLDDRDSPVLAKAKKLVTSVGQRHFDVSAAADFPVAIGMGLKEYLPGAVMPRHYDNQIEGKRTGFGGVLAAAMGQPPAGRQPYACCFYLTDPSEYGGGELLIDDHPPMRPGLGDAVFVRGDVMHSVSEITDGVRHVLRVSVYLNMRLK